MIPYLKDVILYRPDLLLVQSSQSDITYFKVQHRCTDTTSNNGFGVPSNFGVNEVYTQISVQDLSSRMVVLVVLVVVLVVVQIP